MGTKNKVARTEFTLIKIDPFDARRGMVRCSTPGVGVWQEGRRGSATADFWVDSHGQFLVRICSGRDDPLHLVASLGTGGTRIEGQDLAAFCEYMDAVLLGWLTGGDEDAADKVAPHLLQAFIDGSTKLADKLDTNHLWENDATSVPMTAQREKNIKIMGFGFFHSQGFSPLQAYPFDKKNRAEYGQWLKQKN